MQDPEKLDFIDFIQGRVRQRNFQTAQNVLKIHIGLKRVCLGRNPEYFFSRLPSLSSSRNKHFLRKTNEIGLKPIAAIKIGLTRDSLSI